MWWRSALSVLPLAAVLAASLNVLAGGETPTLAGVARPDSTRFLAVRHAGQGPGLAHDREALHEQVKDPLFAFVFTMVEHDSLGHWSVAQLDSFAADWGEASVFPLADHLESLRREALPAAEVAAVDGVVCRRRWVIELSPTRLEMPMPYSILGYHPGKLSFDSPLVLHEWPVGDRSVDVTVEGVTRRYQARALTVFQIVQGWIILDIDAWLDKLLGKAADDSLMQGFVVGWVDGDLLGIGNSAGRRGRRILGELDFQAGEVAAHGRPAAVGISRHIRAWTDRSGKVVRATWQRYDG